jgi:uncharacterized membrane protein YccC
MDRLRRAERELAEAHRLCRASKHPKSADVSRGLQTILGLLEDSSRDVRKMVPVKEEPEPNSRRKAKEKVDV